MSVSAPPFSWQTRAVSSDGGSSYEFFTHLPEPPTLYPYASAFVVPPTEPYIGGHVSDLNLVNPDRYPGIFPRPQPPGSIVITNVPPQITQTTQTLPLSPTAKEFLKWLKPDKPLPPSDELRWNWSNKRDAVTTQTVGTSANWIPGIGWESGPASAPLPHAPGPIEDHGFNSKYNRNNYAFGRMPGFPGLLESYRRLQNNFTRSVEPAARRLRWLLNQ